MTIGTCRMISWPVIAIVSVFCVGRNVSAAPTTVIYEGADSEAVNDLRAALRGYDAGEIRFENVERGDRNGQEFYRERNHRKTLVKYTTAHSLENAVYSLLGQWGFHWYGPGDNWFVKPATVPNDDIVGRWIAPTFRNRAFFGTGGLDALAPNDPKNSYKAGWYAWKRRNRFNSDFAATGHMGVAFYLESKELLDKHPDWFNGEKGKQSGRIKIEIPEAVAAYAAWTKTRSKDSREPFIVIGVDPEDGRGGDDDPLPPDGFAGLKNWNHADKWWWLANEIAKDYPEDGRVIVSMYAYGDGPTNVLIPRFSLRKNVYPVIIPYAFQTAYVPTAMVKTWASRIDGTMGLYDYWNITQWSLGLPQFDIFAMREKLRFWHANKVDGVYVETTDAAGPMGHGWWLAGQLQFDLEQDFDALYRRYLTDLFGKAAPAMKKMYDRWSRNPQGAGEVSLSLANLEVADGLVTRGGPEWKRINELKAYVHFMKLYYGHDGTQASKNRLYMYLYGVHHLYMVQTSAFIGQHYITPFDQGNITPKEVVRPITDEEIDATFKADLKSDPKKYDVSNFRFDFQKAAHTVPIAPSAWRFGAALTAYFEAKKTETVSFDAGNEKSNVRFSVSDEGGVLVQEKVGPANSDYTETIEGRTWHIKRFNLKVEAGKKYTIKFAGGFNRFKMHGKLIVYNVRYPNDFDNYAYPTQYLYVPKDSTEIVFENSAGEPGYFYLPGEKVGKENHGTSIGIKNLFSVAVKPEWRGKAIAAQFAHTSWSLKSLPNVLALQPFDYAE